MSRNSGLVDGMDEWLSCGRFESKGGGEEVSGSIRRCTKMSF